jgi:hypothetical protein
MSLFISSFTINNRECQIFEWRVPQKTPVEFKNLQAYKGRIETMLIVAGCREELEIVLCVIPNFMGPPVAKVDCD